jgi:hypothetical protein
MSNSVSEIDENTVFGIWYGKDMFDRDVNIEDDNLLKFLSEMSKVEGVEGHDSNLFKDLLSHALKQNHIQLPDGARFVRTLAAAKENNWMDIYETLSLAVERNKS